MSILLSTLLEELPSELSNYLNNDPQLQSSCNQYLLDLLVNDDLLSTETFTTTTTSKNKTLIEEIAELDESQRNINVELSSITNENRDLILEISDDLNNVETSFKLEYPQEVESMLKTLEQGNFHININEKLTSNIKVNNSILSKIDSVLDFLELPTLCKVCILQGNYLESLEISILVQALVIRFPKLVIFQQIHHQVEQELKLMVKGLIKLLNTNLKQNNVLKIFHILSKLDLTNFNSSIHNTSSSQKDKFLKIIYLNARFKFITNELGTLKPLIKFNKLTYLKRFIEIYREFIFSSLSMYHSIFNSSTDEDLLLINQFVRNLAQILCDEIRVYLPQIDDSDEFDVQSQKDGLILQIIYLCKSLANYNIDLESIIISDLCFSEKSLFEEEDWLRNLVKVKKIRS
jgi:hypothetical protein